MTNNAIVPMNEISNRLPEHGRIRFGVKTASAMKSIDTLRFTSQDQEAIEQLAEQFGGRAQPWSDPKAAPGQFEVITTSNEVPIVLPPDPLGGSPVYELWTGGGCQRRCDGSDTPTACATIQTVKDNEVETVEVACLCRKEGVLRCKPKLRLAVVIPTIRFGGVWRLDTSSWNAVREIPQQVQMIQAMQALQRQQGMGLTRAFLALKQDKAVVGGKTKNFVFPVLRQEQTFDQILQGAANVQALGTSVEDRAAIGAGTGGRGTAPHAQVHEAPREAQQQVIDVVAAPPAAAEEPEVVDAEIVHEGGDDTPAAPPAPAAAIPPWDEELDRLGLGKGQVLRAARSLADDFAGVQKPTSYDDVKKITNAEFHTALYERVMADA